MTRNASFSRRTFLRNTAAATAATLAAPTIIPSGLFAASGKPPPSERLTVGFIGCGKMANDYHLATLLGFADVQALAVCEVDKSRREAAKARVEKAYSKNTDYKG